MDEEKRRWRALKRLASNGQSRHARVRGRGCSAAPRHLRERDRQGCVSRYKDRHGVREPRQVYSRTTEGTRSWVMPTALRRPLVGRATVTDARSLKRQVSRCRAVPEPIPSASKTQVCSAPARTRARARVRRQVSAMVGIESVPTHVTLGKEVPRRFRTIADHRYRSGSPKVVPTLPRCLRTRPCRRALAYIVHSCQLPWFAVCLVGRDAARRAVRALLHGQPRQWAATYMQEAP